MSSFYKKVLVSLLSLVVIVFAYKALAVGYTPPPSIYYFGASPSTIMQSGSSTISWNAVNAYTCYGSGGWSGLKSAPSGSYTVAPNSTTTYILNCSNEVGASTSRTLTINVTPRNISTSNTCSCYNTGVQCSITDNGSGCTVVDTTGTSVSYCQPGTLVTTTQPYCTPTMTATASPSSLTLSSGSSASTTITMNGSNISGNIQLGTDPATASVGMSLSNYNPPTIPMPQTVTLTITASNLSRTGYVTVSINYGGATSYMLNIPVTVNTATPAPTVTLTVNGSSSATITTNQTANLSWTGNNSTSCSGVGATATSSTPTTLSGIGSFSSSTPLTNYPITEKCYGASGTTPVTDTVYVTVAQNGACSSPATHYTCFSGTSTNNVNGASAWTWDCAGINGGTTAYGCSESKTSPPTGTLSCSPCTITSGSSCTTSISWNTVNPVGTSSVTSPYPSANTVVGTGNYGYNTVTVPYDHRSFYLYNNSQQLATCTSTASISCAAGTVWNGSSCVTAPTGQLTPVTNGCSIQSGQSSCTIPFSWSTTNPIGTSSITSDVDNTGVSSPNYTVTTGNSGSYVNFTIPYIYNYGGNQNSSQPRYFYLYNSGQQLDVKSATASCVNGTSWDVGTGTCKTASPTAPTGVTATTVSSSKINVSWNASTGGNGSPIAYNIYRCVGAGCTPNQYIGWGYPTSYSDTGLSSCTTYGYRIRAYDSETPPLFSGYSTPPAYATTLCPPAVTLTANPTSVPYSGSTTLTWPSISNATSCSASSADGRWSGSQAVSGGSQTISPLLSTTSFSLTCAGTGGSSSATATVTVGAPSPSGSIASSSSCSIPTGSSTCDSALTWSTQNLITGAPTAVTKDNPSATVSTATSGTNVLSAVQYGTTTFYLYHNGSLLSSSTTSATCASGTYNGVSCVPTPVNGACSSPASHYTCSSGTSTNNVNGLTSWTWNCNGSNGGSNASCSETKGSGSLMSGTLSAPSCAILAGANSCNTTMTWNTVNPIGTSAVTSSYPSANTVVASGNSGSQSVTIPYNSRNFYLYNNAGPFDPPLASANPTATCTAGTTWNTTTQKCQNVPPPSPTATITATPNSIVKGSSSTISWSSTNASSCTGTNFSTGNATSGQVTVTPNNTTTYSLVCTGVATQASDQATVTVTVNPKKPKYIEQ